MTQLHRSIGPLQGIAMTVTTFVGTGLLVVPAMSVSLAGDSAVMTWLLTTLLILPVCLVFTLLGVRMPTSAGAAHYVGRAFNGHLEKAVGWLFLSILIVGPAVAIKIAASYLAALFGLSADWMFLLSLAVILGLMCFGLAGIEASANIQTAIVAIMIAAISWLAMKGDISGASAAIWQAENAQDWTFAFQGISVVFWCFLGMEVMAHLGAEFKNPVRDFPIAMIGGLLIVILCYLTLVILIHSHGTYGSDFIDSQSVALLVNAIAGETIGQWFALGGFLIAFANVGIYVLGFARMIQSLAGQGAMPKYFHKLNSRGVPTRGILLVSLICMLSVFASEIAGLKMTWLIEMTNGAFLTIYILASISALKLLSGVYRTLAVLSLIVCLIIAIQIGLSMLFALTALSLSYVWLRQRSGKNASCDGIRVDPSSH